MPTLKAQVQENANHSMAIIDVTTAGRRERAVARGHGESGVSSLLLMITFTERERDSSGGQASAGAVE